MTLRGPVRNKLLLSGAAVLAVVALANRLAAPRSRPPPARHRFVEVDGVRLRYIEQGSGSPVVLLHGNGAMAEDFVVSGIVERLAVRHRVIAFDRPGFGCTGRPATRVWTFAAQADLLRTALRKLGIGRAVLVGHSAGCLAALEIGLRDPERAAALVLLSGFYFPRLRADMLLTSCFALPVLRQFTGLAVAHLVGWLMLPAYLRAVFAPNPVPDRFCRDFPLAELLRRKQVQATIADTPLLNWSAAVLPRRFCALRMPVAIVTGTRDRIVTGPLQSLRLHRCIDGSRLYEIEGAGHMVHHAAPGRVATVIEAAADAAAHQRSETAT